MSSKSKKQQELGNGTVKVRESKAAASPKDGAKKDGTRAGMIEEWRVGNKQQGERRAPAPNRLRDGR